MVVAASLPDFPYYGVGRGPECVRICCALKEINSVKINMRYHVINTLTSTALKKRLSALD